MGDLRETPRSAGLRALGAGLARAVACGTPPADALRALVGAAPEPSIGGNPPTWHCDHQFYTPLVAYAYRFPAFYEIRRSHVEPPISSRALPRLMPYAMFIASLVIESQL